MMVRDFGRDPITPEDVSEVEDYAARVMSVPRGDVHGRIDSDGQGVTVGVRLPMPPTTRVSLTITARDDE